VKAPGTAQVPALLLLPEKRKHNGVVAEKDENRLWLAAALGTKTAEHLKA
jgi:hypothetical protein